MEHILTINQLKSFLYHNKLYLCNSEGQLELRHGSIFLTSMPLALDEYHIVKHMISVARNYLNNLNFIME